MTKAELVRDVAERHPALSRTQSVQAVELVLEILKRRLASGERVLITNFGSFEVLDRQARRGRDPATGDIIRIQPRRTVVFRAARKLEDELEA